jgi:hypothetical protein
MEYQIIEIDKESKIKLKIKKNKENDLVDPMLELYKGKLFSFLIKNFSNDCIDYFGTHIFSIKKSFNRTLTNILSSWMFSLYINYDFSSDYFFPTNYTDTEYLENTLKDLCKYDDKILNQEDKIKRIITNLKINYKNLLKILDEYKKSYNYINNKQNYRIKKIMTNIKKNKSSEKETTFYKFEIVVGFIIKDKRLQNILNNILIPTKIYDKLSEAYTGPSNMIDDYLWSIIFRYQLLGSNNHQLAVLPNIMNNMKIDYKLNFECFASAINSTFKNYCSIYWDLEKYFGSVGSFFNMIPLKGTFGFNPPYQKDIINLGITKLFECLKESTEELTFIITIPIWDTEGRNIMKELYNNELEKQNIEYGDFPIISEIKKSDYYRELLMIPKDKFTYVDHNFELYKNKTIQNTYIIILSNINKKFDYINNYDFENNYVEFEQNNEIEILKN